MSKTNEIIIQINIKFTKKITEKKAFKRGWEFIDDIINCDGCSVKTEDVGEGHRVTGTKKESWKILISKMI